jgi:predicted TIM-barrel fold metal-dependent hydrolase
MQPDVSALLAQLDACNVAGIVNLDGRWGDELEENLDRYDRAHPGRFATFCQVDWRILTEQDDASVLATSLGHSVSAGAKGLKVWKDLGLRVRDRRGILVKPNDPRLGAVWAAAGDLGIPVLMHTADPLAFFLPPDTSNERLEELREFPGARLDHLGVAWRQELLSAFEEVVASHPQTTFVGAHVAGNAEDLPWVSRMLDEYPNLVIDLAARISELGRQPRATRHLVMSHVDRVLFGGDIYPVRSEEYAILFRFLETSDEDFAYTTAARPLQGRWRVSGLALPGEVLRAVYCGNARRLLPAFSAINAT